MSRRRASRTLELLNPLRGLTPAQVVGRIEAAQRGDLALYQWTLHIIEQADPDYSAVVSRCLAPLLAMDWDIKTVSPEESAQPIDDALATEQANVLRAAYEKIENLYEAFSHMALAKFRGFSIAQLVAAEADGLVEAAPGDATQIDCLRHWNFVRDGIERTWRWNPDATSRVFESLNDAPEVRPVTPGFLVRDYARPVGRIALTKFIHCNFATKAWGEFLEICAEQGIAVIGPPGVDISGDKAEEYVAGIESYRDGGHGLFPGGSQIVFANNLRGTVPFEARMRYLREQLVLAATGGLHTMLAEPTGIGPGSSESHQDGFEQLAQGEAREISEIFQRKFDKPLLQARFPGRPQLAYFEIASRKETNVSQIIKDAAAMPGSGYRIKQARLEEETGYELEPYTAAAPQEPPTAFGAAYNRAAGARASTAADDGDVGAIMAETRLAVGRAIQGDLKPIAERVAAIIERIDAGATADEVQADVSRFLSDELPGLAERIIAEPSSVEAYVQAMSAALANGIESATEGKP